MESNQDTDLNMDKDGFQMDDRDQIEVVEERGQVKTNQLASTKTTTDIEGNTKCHV